MGLYIFFYFDVNYNVMIFFNVNDIRVSFISLGKWNLNLKVFKIVNVKRVKGIYYKNKETL